MAAASSTFKIKCPSCEAMVTIRDPGLAGKKIDCPKCKYRFVVELPAGVGGDDDDDAPSKKGSDAPVKSKGKKLRSESDDDDGGSKPKGKPLPKREDDDEDADAEEQGKKKLNTTLLIGGGLAVLAIGVLVVFFMSGSEEEKPKNVAKVDASAKQPGPVTPPTPPTPEPKKDNSPPPKEEPKVPTPEAISTDITNLLPGDTQWVLKASGKELLETPIGKVLFEPSSDSAKAFHKWMGFSADDVEKFVCSGGLDKAWFFSILQTKKEIKIEDLKKAMDLATNPQVIKGKYDLYAIKSNELIKMVSDYLTMKLNSWGLKAPAAPFRNYALCLLDPQTLVISDRDQLEQFLEADARRKFQSTYVPPEAPSPKGPAGPGTPMPPPKKEPPKKEPMPMGASETPFTTIPTYLSIHPALKAVLNQLEGDKSTVVTFGVMVPDALAAGLKELSTLLGDLFPKIVITQTGFCVRQMDSKRLNVVIANVYADAAKAQDDVTFLNKSSVNPTAALLSKWLKVPVGTQQNPSGVWADPMAQPDPANGMPPMPKAPTGGANSPSMLSVSAADKFVLGTLDIDWSNIYFKQIEPPLRSYVDLVQGEALMMTGRSHWFSMDTALKQAKSGKDPALPAAAFPRNTNAARYDLPYPADERISWMAEMLPFLGHDRLSRMIDRQAPWNEENNLHAGMAWVPEFLDPQTPPHTWRAYLPSLKGKGIGLGATNFVGLTGIGMDSGEYPDTPEYAKRLGLFGYNRRTKFSDITDGESNTIFMIQVPPNIQRPWIRGGGSTAQGVPETGSIKPFISTEKAGARGTQVMMADGSVRFISDSIDDKVFKALVTFKGGEKIDSIDKIAPVAERPKESALVSPKAETKKDEPKADDKKDEPKKADPKKEEPKKEELKVDPKPADPKKADPKKAEPKKGL